MSNICACWRCNTGHTGGLGCEELMAIGAGTTDTGGQTYVVHGEGGLCNTRSRSSDCKYKKKKRRKDRSMTTDLSGRALEMMRLWAICNR